MSQDRADTVRISIKEVTGQNIWVSADDGQSVFEAVAAPLRAGDSVCVSFAGGEHVITSFLNFAIGQLYAGSIPWNELDARLSFEDLGDGDRDKIDMVVLNAKRYFQQRNQQPSL
ncbi:STAS-like domain-containing protein [Agrobacterium rubi]|nr:STAS-like domain-containing protein [Agrobacterium rubi]NTF24973.1 STAS-like domain-containing protein [Agrobacterium rubi]